MSLCHATLPLTMKTKLVPTKEIPLLHSEIDLGMRGAQPYMFEPSGDKSDEGHNEDSDEDDPRRYRLNNSNW